MSKFHKCKNGIVACGDILDQGLVGVAQTMGPATLIIADPMYGGILKGVEWDERPSSLSLFIQWMIEWTYLWSSSCLIDGGSFYTWGCVGLPKFRPFLSYIPSVEFHGDLELANLITWKKKKAYGVPNNYLFTREELAWFVKGPAKKPAVFHIPLLDQERGYAGWNKKYPAKSKYLRRTNVWTDVTEVLRGKIHDAEKPERMSEILIQTHSNPGDLVIDLFSGSGNTSVVAERLGRRFFALEKDPETWDKIWRRFESTGKPAAEEAR